MEGGARFVIERIESTGTPKAAYIIVRCKGSGQDHATQYTGPVEYPFATCCQVYIPALFRLYLIHKGIPGGCGCTYHLTVSKYLDIAGVVEVR